MLARIKNWFLGLAGVPALKRELASQQLKCAELQNVLNRERSENSFERDATFETKIRVAVRRKVIAHREAKNIITLLNTIAEPVNFKIERAPKVEETIVPQRKGLSSTGH